MPSGYRTIEGTDLDDLFYTNNAGPAPLGFVDVNGVDLGTKYIEGSVPGLITGYKLPDGRDLAEVRGKVSPPVLPATGGGWNGNPLSGYSDGITDRWISEGDYDHEGFAGYRHYNTEGKREIQYTGTLNFEFDTTVTFYVRFRHGEAYDMYVKVFSPPSTQVRKYSYGGSDKTNTEYVLTSFANIRSLNFKVLLYMEDYASGNYDYPGFNSLFNGNDRIIVYYRAQNAAGIATSKGIYLCGNGTRELRDNLNV